MKSTMHLLAWNDYLKTGIDIVDQQHRGLVDLTNQTAEKLSSGQDLSIDEMRTVLGFLMDYAATHFSTEEALMALSGIDEQHVEHHRQSHANFLKQVMTMVDELGGEGGVTAHQLIDFLGNWLIYHMLGEDQIFSRLLRKESVPMLAGETGGQPAAAGQALPAQEAANRSLSKLYAFMASRSQQLQINEQLQRHRSNQMQELVAEQTAELAASEERFHALFHNGVLPTILMRLEANLMPGLIVDVNPAACKLLGYGLAEMLNFSPLDFVAAEEIDRFPMLISELLVTGRFECEMTLLTRAGQRLMTEMTMAQFVMNGQPVVMTIIQDVSARRAKELGQAELRQQARHLAEIRSGFLATARPPVSYSQHAPLRVLAAGPGRAMGPSQIAAFLAAQPLFKDVAAEDQALLCAASRVLRLRKGESLFAKGSPPSGLFLVVCGHVMLAVSSAQGDVKVLGIFGYRESLGEAEVVMNSPYPYFAEAVDEAEVLEVGQGALLSVLDKDNHFARRLMQCIGSRQHDLVHDVESYTLRSGAERVIGYLLQHATIHPGGRLKVELPATKQLIASLLHVKPETLSRIFRNLSEAGLVQIKGARVEIPDVDKLIAYQA